MTVPSPGPAPAPAPPPAPAPGPAPDPAPAPAPPPTPDPFGRTTEANVASIQKTVLDPYCIRCHGATNPRANLDLRDLEAFLPGAAPSDATGQYRGNLLVPGSPETSLLLARIAAPDEFRMPPKASGLPRVKDQQAQAIEAWIRGLTSQSAE